MLNARSVRKALMSQNRLTYSAIAAEVPCSIGLVAHVFAERNRYETPKTKRIKEVLSERTGVPVANLWPDPSA